MPGERGEGWHELQGCFSLAREMLWQEHTWLLPTLVQRGISSCQSGMLSVCPPTQASIKIQAGLNVCQSPAAEARAPDAGTPGRCGEGQD